MGLLRRVVMLPLAPLEGVMWLAGVLQEMAEEERHDPARLRAVLEEAEVAHQRGELGDEELAALQDQILEQLMGPGMVAGDGAWAGRDTHG